LSIQDDIRLIGAYATRVKEVCSDLDVSTTADLPEVIPLISQDRRSKSNGNALAGI
jgi:hypothetical protein